jgi:hypothetical protein
MIIVAFVVKAGVVVVPIGVIVGVSMGLLRDAIVVMRERHALGASDSRHALDRYGQGQQQHSNKPEERLSHQRAL